MDRKLLEGVWIPRNDLIGWSVTAYGISSTHESPGPVVEGEIELDANGCLSSGTLKLVRPRPAYFPAFSFTASLSLLSRSRGWVPVGQGYVPPARQDGEEEWALELRPLEELTLDGYYDASVAHNTLDTDVNAWTETNRSVIERSLKSSPTASVGVDWAGRMILARPEDGSPVRLSRAQFHSWKNLPDVVLPYLTAARWDGGPGWKKGEYTGITRPPLAPLRVQDAGEVRFEEVVRRSGPPLVEEREFILDPLVVNGGSPVPSHAVRLGNNRNTVTARYYAHIQVYDFQTWYEGSALVGQESPLEKGLQEEVKTLEGAYALAAATLGEDDPLTIQEKGKLTDAQNALRLARTRNRMSGEGSDYEPLSAALNMGLAWDGTWMFSDRYDVENWMKESQPATAQYQGADLSGRAVEDYGVGNGYLITGLTLWISRVSWDDEAFTLEFPATSSESETTQFEMVHPETSPNTLKVFETQVQEYEMLRQSAFTTGNLTIPPEYFRGPLGPALAKLMDQEWRAGYDPDEPPEGEEPPSREWDGKWYLHVASWWRSASNDQVGSPFGKEVFYLTVTRWAGNPQFGVKEMTPPGPPEQLSWPTTWGPNAEGEINGALLPPALVDGQPVAASRFRLSPASISSTVAVGVLPFKESGSI